VELEPCDLPARKEVLRMEGVAWASPDGRPVLSGIDLTMRGPERVAVTGPNGSGKSTLLRLVVGDLAADRGEIVVGVDDSRVAWLDQSAALLGRSRTVLEAFRGRHPDLAEAMARHRLARFLFPGEEALKPVEALSGGERMRAALACVLGGSRVPSLLLLDEPTNHLDLDSLETVEEAVAAYDGALLVVSHDPDFLEAVGVERRLELG
jgi:ATPase subunit of ABC transporter with duplicated ATPase domains